MLCYAYSFARSFTQSRAQGKELFVYQMNALILYHFNPLCALGPFEMSGQLRLTAGVVERDEFLRRVSF